MTTINYRTETTTKTTNRTDTTNNDDEKDKSLINYDDERDNANDFIIFRMIEPVDNA